MRRVLTRQRFQLTFETFDKQNPAQSPALLSPQVLNYLKKIRSQAKAELDRWTPIQEKPPPLVHLLPMFVVHSHSFFFSHLKQFFAFKTSRSFIR